MSTKLMTHGYTDPFATLRRMSTEFDRLFEEAAFPTAKWSLFRTQPALKATNWLPQIDVFERDNRLVTKVDLPGMKKDEVKVEVNEGYLTISGERKIEVDTKKGEFYRCEREYGSFYRAVPLPDGVKFDDVKASFADGVLEVSVPVPVTAKKTHHVEIEEMALT